MSEEETVEIYWAKDAQEAHQVKALLERAGISARVVGELLIGGAGELPMGLATSPRVWVSRADAGRARQLCAEWEQARGSDRAAGGSPWTCARCGSSVEGNFDICWSCQSPRDAGQAAPAEPAEPTEPAE